MNIFFNLQLNKHNVIHDVVGATFVIISYGNDKVGIVLKKSVYFNHLIRFYGVVIAVNKSPTALTTSASVIDVKTPLPQLIT